MMNRFFEKLTRASGVLANGGMLALIERLLDYIRYNIKDKWRFIYFELNIKEIPYSLPEMDASLVVRRAVSGDIKKIKNDMYPFMTAKQEFDKRYIERIGDDDFECFIAEKEGEVVHYFMMFNSALDSPLLQTPFDRKKILTDDAYLSSTFTVPEARGMWIVPHVLLSIILYLRNKKNIRRVLLLVHEDTPGATGFFQRLGFTLLDDVGSKTPFYFMHSK